MKLLVGMTSSGRMLKNLTTRVNSLQVNSGTRPCSFSDPSMVSQTHPFFVSRFLKSSTSTTATLLHQQLQIHTCITTHYKITLFQVSSHLYHIIHFLLPRYLLLLLPITYYLLYCYLFPSFLFPVSCSRIPNSLTLTLTLTFENDTFTSSPK